MVATGPQLRGLLPGMLVQRLERIGGAPSEWVGEPVEVAALQMDVSGFSHLTEALSSADSSGPEDVVALLDRYFSTIVEAIHRGGGHVLTFAGDAVVAVWPAGPEAPLPVQVARAFGAGVTARDACSRIAEGSDASLRFRIGVGAGPAVEMHLGGRNGEWVFAVAGDATADMGAALLRSSPDEVRLSDTAAHLIGAGMDGAGGVVPPDMVTPLRDLAPAVADAAVRYLPSLVLELASAGRLSAQSEHRPTTAVLVNLPTVDTTLRSAQARLQEAVVVVQEQLTEFDGSLLGAIPDDKGLTLVAGFGLPPSTPEEKAVKAVTTATRVQESLTAMRVDHGIGVASGRTFSGVYGSDLFRQFSFIGPSVNLAARLMQAGSNEVLCDEATVRATRRRFHFVQLPPFAVKGRTEPIVASRPSWTQERRLPSGPSRGITGRDDEFAVVARELADMVDRPGTIVVEGEAGIGKTALVAEAVRHAEALGFRTLVTGADPVGTAPYQAWRSVVQRVLGFDETYNAGERERNVHSALSQDERLSVLAPLLNPLTGLTLAETPVTSSMSADGRRERVVELLVLLLRRHAGEDPLLLVVEDVHWLDDASWTALERALADVGRLSLLVSTRPVSDPAASLRRIREKPSTSHVELGNLAETATRALAAQSLGVEGLPDPVASFVTDRSEGHPLFVEELVYHLRDEGYLEIEGGRVQLTVPSERLDLLELPDTVHDITVSRLARLTAAQQMTLKTASVSGDAVAVDQVVAIHPFGLDRDAVIAHLRRLAEADLVRETDGGYRFKHAITKESVYAQLPRRLRRELHEKVASHLTATDSRDHALLAHHWEGADRVAAALNHWEAAAAEALVRGAHGDGLRFYRRCQSMVEAHPDLADVPPWRRAFWLGEMAEAHGEMGRVDDQIRFQRQALSLTGASLPSTRAGEVWRLATSIVVQVWHLVRRRSVPPPTSTSVHHRAAYEASKLTPSYYYTGDVFRMAMVSLEAVNRAERSGDPAVAGLSYIGLGTLVGVLRMKRLALHYFGQARVPLALAPTEGVTGEPASSVMPDFGELNRVGADLGQAIVELQAGDTDARRLLVPLDDALERARTLEATQYVGALLTARGLVRSLCSSASDALEDFEFLTVESRRRDQPQHEAWALALQIPIRVDQGDLDGAVAASDAAEEISHRADPISRPLLKAARCLALAAAGRDETDAALRDARTHLGLAPVFLFVVAFSSVLDAVRISDDDRHGRLRRSTVRRFRWYALMLPFARGRVHYYRAIAAGSPGRAARQFARAAACSEASGHHLDVLRCHVRAASTDVLSESVRQHHADRAEEIRASLDAPLTG